MTGHPTPKLCRARTIYQDRRPYKNPVSIQPSHTGAPAPPAFPPSPTTGRALRKADKAVELTTTYSLSFLCACRVDSSVFSLTRPPAMFLRKLSPTFIRLSALFGLALFVLAVGCQTGTRSYGDGDEAAASESESVQPAGDPRFPRSYATNRKGYWIDMPRRTGTVSPTALATAVGERLDGVASCCSVCDGRRGQFSVQLDVQPNGATNEVTLVESPTADSETQQCITDAIADGQYPEAERPYEVIVPIHYDLRDEAGSDASERDS